MPLPPISIGSPQADTCLHLFLTTRSQPEADRELARVMEVATPLIAVRLSRIGRSSGRADLLDSISEARTQLVSRLQNLRREHLLSDQPQVITTVSDFEAYVVTVARMAAAQAYRRRHPARAMLLNRLRYLLEGRTNQRGFAVWKSRAGETWTGFEMWRDQQASRGTNSERLSRLLADPQAAAREIFGTGCEESALPLGELVSRLFRWLDEPLRLRDLTDAVAAWQGVGTGRGEPLGIDDADQDEDQLPISKEPSPHDALRWKEYLRWLWGEALQLTLPQRTAFLLHSSCLREMELQGLVGVRQTAGLLELTPEQMAQHWSRLPLEDRIIGEVLDVTPQQVINLRKAARMVLGRAWHRFLYENHQAGNL